jgi:hypothetical protein
VAVNLDDRGVDHGVFHVRILRDRAEKPFEDIGLGDSIAASIADENEVGAIRIAKAAVRTRALPPRQIRQKTKAAQRNCTK